MIEEKLAKLNKYYKKKRAYNIIEIRFINYMKSNLYIRIDYYPKDLIYKFPKNPKKQAITDEDYSYQINNVAMNALSTKAIQELHGIVKNQQKQINELKQELEELRRERNG